MAAASRSTGKGVHSSSTMVMSASSKVLDLDRPLGRQLVARAVDVGLEGDALLGDLPEFGQRHDLEAAGVGQDRPGPVHEAVQAAQPGLTRSAPGRSMR